MKKIVLVDDSQVALEWAKEVLSARGYVVDTYSASLGIQAFIRSKEPDLVLLDVSMPALNGDAVCRMLKANPKTATVKIALYSSMAEDQLIEMTQAAGADGYIIKSEDANAFARRVSEILG